MNCDPIARWYRWLEYAGFGRALERRRLAFLPCLAESRRVLMLGEGDGRFLAAFLRANPAAEVDYVDGSGKMLALARNRSLAVEGAGERVRFHQAEALAWLLGRPAGTYDLVCTHFFLDCFTTVELGPLVAAITRQTQGHARWIVSEFCYPAGGVAGWAGRVFITSLYGFFRVVTALAVDRLSDYPDALQAAGFRCTEREIAAAGLLVSESWERL